PLSPASSLPTTPGERGLCSLSFRRFTDTVRPLLASRQGRTPSMLAEKIQAEAPDAAAVLDIVRALARELQPQRKSWQSLTLGSSLERDFGLDSLSRIELLARLEKSFGVRLSEDVLGSAETPRDLLQAVLGVQPAAAPAARPEIAEPLSAGEAAPDRTRSLVEVLEWHAWRDPGRR